jgi:hypothetical protein
MNINSANNPALAPFRFAAIWNSRIWVGVFPPVRGSRPPERWNSFRRGNRIANRRRVPQAMNTKQTVTHGVSCFVLRTADVRNCGDVVVVQPVAENPNIAAESSANRRSTGSTKETSAQQIRQSSHSARRAGLVG